MKLLRRVICGLALLGCASPLQPTSPPAWTSGAPLLASEKIRGDFSMRQRLSFRVGEHDKGAIDAVLQVHCGEVVVVALTPLGTRLFSIRQRGLSTEVEGVTSHPLAFAPLRVLLDVHRVYLYPVADPPLPDGGHGVRVGSLKLVEQWRGGRLVRRTIPDRDGDAVGRVVVTYEGGLSPTEVPPRVLLRNELYGYELEIETIERQELRCPEPIGTR